MKLILTNAAFPDLNLDALLDKAAALDFDGIELATLHGQPDLGLTADFETRAEQVRARLAETGRHIAAIHAGTFSPPAGSHRALIPLALEQTLRAAAAVGAPLVIISGADTSSGTDREELLQRYVAALPEPTLRAAELGVSLTLENTGVLSRTADLWYVHDAVGMPNLRVCLDPRRSTTAGDSPSFALTRLAGALSIVRLSEIDPTLAPEDDHRFTPEVSATNYAYLIELLRGLAYRGYLAISPPHAAQQPPDDYFQTAAKAIRAELARPRVVLTAYKADKTGPRFVAQP